ncbi:MAG: hypothetical protein A3B91_03380 [Candidatus Yanofskybacteria bacterium RIFCSPHIGHO2_02_FULL_41_29]|uniref:Uncharacterized protein n=1 Tax=Candidatus Yanofskybacteria bacterium RIFCSPHIGHO2_01_FULL_41_53 TaxID=1802663 RepID=A0A1F8EGT2_9BACT|nr:MAG: hypothetical protein A2650_01205 [Candidatus Yanofskybacteria bacterium RIFCSPHIGHO2_01_FULL_41_53]OGN10703.1 MAG: hypothetical protein A3B91_03380 [Candidatus Yanofskybacteria bacterium RIFCSPHIGHO2_02_FULL_41_29]OGN18784.1 MAG: hypothetical protein A3F48_02440 [Candidatus Yanofskybacteria bacterium RIFCSPHIGHO2_12_FULL_41_9]OGN24039.1 MAG: hypothetical protein A2916_04750 [Candidatus Yanofskybacteria bacterium RIFCSPLOWO2_01_FULL_41_67]OGN30501.1 MAG: hypothetical protein A3H54_00550 
MNTIKDCFDIILSSNENDSRLAARRVRKLLYSATASPDRSKHNEINNVINNALDTYSKIQEEWRQENFVMAASVIYWCHDKESQPDFLFPWFFQLLQHSNGYIRHAAVRMFSHEIWPLTVHIRIPGYKLSHFDKLTPEQANKILHSLSADLNKLLATLWQPKYKRYKYIDSLPVSPYKSVQMVLSELEESCEQEHSDRFTGRFSNDNIGIA